METIKRYKRTPKLRCLDLQPQTFSALAYIFTRTRRSQFLPNMRISSFVIFTLSYITALCTAADNLFWRSSEDRSAYDLLSRLVEPRTDTGSTGEYVVWAKDGSKKDAVKKTEDLLKQLTKQSSVYSFTDHNGDLRLWTVNVTSSQVDTIKKDDGVASVVKNAIEAEEDAAVPVPTEPAKLLEASKEKRDTQYSTQLNAAYELKQISQPP